MRQIREAPNEWTRVFALDTSPDYSDFLPRHQSEGSRARKIFVDNDSRYTQFIPSLSTGSMLCRELPSNLNIQVGSWWLGVALVWLTGVAQLGVLPLPL